MGEVEVPLVQAGALTLLAVSEGGLGAAIVAAVLLGLGTALVYPTLIAAMSDAIAELFAPIADRPAPKLKTATKPSKTRVKLLGKRTEQAHVCIGWRGVPQVHPDKYKLDMLNGAADGLPA